MIIKRLTPGFLLAVFICALAGWVLPATPQQTHVTIGIPLPLSGIYQEFGQMMKNSFVMAKEEINQTGGIHGRPLEVVFADDKGDVASAVSAFEDLMSKAEPVMLVGGYASDPTYQLAKMAQKQQIPFVICTASADKITQRGWKQIYRINPPISEYTKGLEDFWIKNFKPKKMVIIYENSMYGTSGAVRMIEFCSEKAIEIQAHIDYDRTMVTAPGYLRSLLAPLVEEPPDVIYMISYFEDAVALVKEIRELKIEAMLCGGAGGFTLEEFIAKTGKAAGNLFTASLWSKHVRYPGAADYYTKYKERYATPPDYHGAEAYSALLVAAEALNHAESFSSPDIRAALNQIYMQTPFGPVKFYSYDEFERQNSVDTLVLQIINGRFETVWPPDIASARFILPKKH